MWVARSATSKTGYLAPICSSYIQSCKLCPALLIRVLVVHDFVPVVCLKNHLLRVVSVRMDPELLGLGHGSLLLHDVAAVAGVVLLDSLLTAFPLKHPSRLRAMLVLRREISSARTATAGMIQFSVFVKGQH